MTRHPTTATMRDVARQAGVSLATVSRALSLPELVAPPTRQRVDAAVRRLGYEHSRAARSTARTRSGFIGVVAPDLINPFFLGVLTGIQDGARAAGRHVLLVDSTEDPTAEAELTASIARRTDGLILLSSRLPASALRDLPCPRAVLFNRMVSGLPAVLLDHADGIRQLVSHLVYLGHSHCAYAGGPRDSFADALRRRALDTACTRVGLRLTDLGSFPPRRSGGARAADLVLNSQATALIAFNDLMALGAVAHLRELGVPVPARMSVTGFDDVPIAGLATPGLTTVAAPLHQAGRAAVSLLAGESAGAEASQDASPQAWTLPVRLVVRASSAPPPRR
jgi:DNA-binding LacI/PurR family transcriptional regulator